MDNGKLNKDNGENNNTTISEVDTGFKLIATSLYIIFCCAAFYGGELIGQGKPIGWTIVLGSIIMSLIIAPIIKRYKDKLSK